ncbi:MAG: glycosyltransferase [Phototrophicaceae bacterium]
MVSPIRKRLLSGFMHILHLTPYYAPAYAFGGVPRVVQGMAEGAVKRGHTVTVLTSHLPTQAEAHSVDEARLNGVQVIRVPHALPHLRGRFNLSTSLGMHNHLRGLLPQVDLIHTHEFRTVENILLWNALRQCPKPTVLSPHGTLGYTTGRSLLKQGWDRVFSRPIASIISRAIALTAVEQGEIQRLWASLGAHPIEVPIIPNGVNLDDFATPPNLEAFRERYHLSPHHQVVLFMGRLHPRKGVDVLAQAIHSWANDHVRLLIVGPDEGLRPTLEALSQQDPRLILCGYLTGEDRLAAYRVADVLVLPAVGEGLSMAVLEAMANGLPVLISEGCNLPEVVEANAGRLVSIAVDDLREALVNVLDDTAVLAQMSENALGLVKERFTWDAVSAQLEQHYQQLLSP